MISGPGRIANGTPSVTLPAQTHPGVSEPITGGSHLVFLASPYVHSGPGDVINNHSGPIIRNSEEVALNAPILLVPFQVSPEGVSFVVSRHVVVGSGRCPNRVDAAPHHQARHCGFLPAEHVDGGRQGPEEGLGAPIAGALPCASCGCNGADPDCRAAVLVRRLDRFCNSPRGRPRQGILRLHLRSEAGASMVLVADRDRSGAAPSHRFRSLDLHGGELSLPASGLASRLNTLKRCGPTSRSIGLQPSLS